MNTQCKNCHENCSQCAIYLGKNGAQFGYGIAQGYDNSDDQPEETS